MHGVETAASSTGSATGRVTPERRSWRRRAELLLALTESDLRARYGRGGARLFKWLLDPFALVGVYLLLVSVVLNRPGAAPGLSLACAVVPFQLLMMSVINAMGAVDLRRSIILNMSFERTFIPASGVLTETVAFAASFLLLVLMLAIYRIAPTFALLWFPVVVAVNVLLAVALAYVASLIGIWFSDLRQFAISIVRTLFFLAPGLVPLSMIGGRANDLLRLNPLTGVFEGYRSVLLYGRRPSAWELLFPAAIALVVLAITLPIYVSEQKQFAKVVA
ncbi:MAG: lipopolysaccharide transport system permease protein [Gaiellaceae bacterium]|nr:lipopolysaccharide transport system permease protein [Gaiellaceae bacterium]